MSNSVTIMILFTILSKGIGFLRDMVLAYYYGAGVITDAYLLSYTIPGLIFAFIGAGIASSYIPIYSRIEKDCSQNSNDFTSNVINCIFIVITPIVIFMHIYTYQIVGCITNSLSKEIIDLAGNYIRITIFTLYFSVVIHILGAFLNFKGSFAIPVFVGVIFNSILLGSIAVSAYTNKYMLATGVLIALFVQMLIIYYFACKLGFSYKFKVNLYDEQIRSFIKLSLPVVLGISVNQINVIVDQYLASTFGQGSISYINYANRIIQFIQGIFVLPFVTALYPDLARLAANNKFNEFNLKVNDCMKNICLHIIPISIFIIFFSKIIIEILFKRGSFTGSSVIVTAQIFSFYALGVIAVGLREILSRVYFSVQDMKTPTINSFIGIIFNIILNFWFSNLFGLKGLALATSFSAFITVILLFLNYQKRFNTNIWNALFYMAKILIISIITCFLSYCLFLILINSIDSNIAFAIVILFTIFLYCVSLLVTKIKKSSDFLGGFHAVYKYCVK